MIKKLSNKLDFLEDEEEELLKKISKLKSDLKELKDELSNNRKKTKEVKEIIEVELKKHLEDKSIDVVERFESWLQLSNKRVLEDKSLEDGKLKEMILKRKPQKGHSYIIFYLLDTPEILKHYARRNKEYAELLEDIIKQDVIIFTEI